MDTKTKACIDNLIQLMEAYEQAAREGLAKKKLPNDPFMDGWSHGIHLSWAHRDPKRSGNGTNQMSCFYEWNGISIPRERDIDSETDVDLLFLTKAAFKQDIVPALRQWAQNKVDNEPYGGMFGATFCIELNLHTHREIRPEDPPHMQGQSAERASIRVKDETRLEARRQLVRKFIAEEGYKTVDIFEIRNSLTNICVHAAGDLFEEFGEIRLAEFFGTLLERYQERRLNSGMFLLLLAFASAAITLTETEQGQQHTEAELSLACQLSIYILLHASDKYERKWGTDTLKAVVQLGYKPAKDILKFGTGKIPADVMQHKSKLVNCTANDIEKTVDFKVKEESAEAYATMVGFLVGLLRHNFPGEYKIKFNSKVKNYIDTELKATKTNNFFANAAQYKEVHGPLKEYARLAFDAYNYYSDAEEEEAVTCGGYAAMALAFADPVNNLDIALEFLEHSDFEHAITSRHFTEDFAAVCKGADRKKVEAFEKEY